MLQPVQARFGGVYVFSVDRPVMAPDAQGNLKTQRNGMLLLHLANDKKGKHLQRFQSLALPNGFAGISPDGLLGGCKYIAGRTGFDEDPYRFENFKSAEQVDLALELLKRVPLTHAPREYYEKALLQE